MGRDILDHPGDSDFPLVVNPDGLAHGIFIGEQGPGRGLVNDDGVWVFEHGKRIAFDKRETEHLEEIGGDGTSFRKSFLCPAQRAWLSLPTRSVFAARLVPAISGLRS